MYSCEKVANRSGESEWRIRVATRSAAHNPQKLFGKSFSGFFKNSDKVLTNPTKPP